MISKWIYKQILIINDIKIWAPKWPIEAIIWKNAFNIDLYLMYNFIFVFLTFGTRELILLIIIFDSIKCKMPTKSWNYFVFPLQVHLQIRNTLENFHILIEVAVLPIIHIDIGCWINKRKSCATALAKQVVDNVSFFLIEVVICYFQLQIFQSIVSI